MSAEKRRVTKLINDGRQSRNVESFAQVLQRISSKLDFKAPSAPQDVERTAAEVLATLPSFTAGSIAPPTPQGIATYATEDNIEDNIESLSFLFFKDLGMANGAEAGANFWSKGGTAEEFSGPTPPDTYSFLGSSNGNMDWSSRKLVTHRCLRIEADYGRVLELVGAPLDANALAATALLDQMSLPW